MAHSYLSKSTPTPIYSHSTMDYSDLLLLKSKQCNHKQREW